jgi:VanZ family protein
LLAVLPINNGEKLNDIFILQVRGDYLVHFAIFIPLMALIRFYTGHTFRTAALKTAAWIAAALTLAVATEYIQYFLTYRAFNINDMAANVMGVLIGSGFFFVRVSSER